MQLQKFSFLCVSLFLCSCVPQVWGQGIQARGVSGTARAFLVIRNEDGKLIGRGEFTQTAHGSQVSSTLSLRLPNGSLDEDTTHYSQFPTIKFTGDHHVQRGSFFSKQIDMTVDANGHTTLSTMEKDKSKTEEGEASSSRGLLNGMVGTALLNWPKDTHEQTFDYLAPVGKGRVIQLKISTERRDTFEIGGTTVSAEVYRIHYDLGGLTGLIAPVVGKQPDDAFVWVTTGVPSIVREQGALYDGGPAVSIELAGATFRSKQNESSH